MAVLDCNFIAQEFMVISVISSYGYNHSKWESSCTHEIVEKMWFLSSRPKSRRSMREVQKLCFIFLLHEKCHKNVKNNFDRIFARRKCLIYSTNLNRNNDWYAKFWLLFTLTIKLSGNIWTWNCIWRALFSWCSTTTKFVDGWANMSCCWASR